MSREERLELLLSSLCLAGINLLRHPMKPAVRQMLRADIEAARAFLKAGVEPDPEADSRPEPPVPDEAPVRQVRAQAAGAPDYWWNRL